MPLPEDWDNFFWDSRINVCFGAPRFGWITLAVLSTGKRQLADVSLSDVFDPLPGMVDWLCQIVRQEWPAVWEVYEEGCTSRFQVWPDERHPPALILRIARTPDGGSEDLLLLARVRKDQLLTAFLRSFERFLAEDLDLEEWHCSDREESPDEPTFDPRKLDLSEIKGSRGSLG